MTSANEHRDQASPGGKGKDPAFLASKLGQPGSANPRPARISYTRYIGRIGALAVALGISGAVATTPAVAWADEPSTPDSSSSSPSESNPASGSAGPAGSGGSSSAKGTSKSLSETLKTARSGVIVRSSGGAHTSSGKAASQA